MTPLTELEIHGIDMSVLDILEVRLDILYIEQLAELKFDDLAKCPNMGATRLAALAIGLACWIRSKTEVTR